MASLGETNYTYRYPKGTIIIDTWYSTCGDCDKSATPNESHHNTILGYGPLNGTAGCGVEFKYAASNYMGLKMKETVKAKWPHLSWVGWD